MGGCSSRAALLKAVQFGDEAEVRRLCLQHKDCNFLDHKSGSAPVHVAVMTGNVEVCARLL
jgi:hypothetical protein